MKPHPVCVAYTAETADNEKLEGLIYTISSEQLRDATEQVMDKYPKEELHNLCLIVQS